LYSLFSDNSIKRYLALRFEPSASCTPQLMRGIGQDSSNECGLMNRGVYGLLPHHNFYGKSMAAAKETTEQKEFREYCAAWLDENRPPPTKMPLPQAAYEVTNKDHRDYLVEWQSKCYEAGFIATDVPKEYGGHGHTGFQGIASTEVRRANVPYFINWIGLGMTAPTLLIHGTEEQKKT
jgi:alkylation response protein AidB-like acyl-CoA dehydrogenase